MSDPANRPDDAEDGLAGVPIRHEAWIGPLPPPQFLKQFDDVVENGAERIMRQWEQESDHRRAMEREEIKIFARADLLGRILSFAFVLVSLGVAVLAIVHQQPWVAAILGGTTIASIVWAFMTTHRDSA